MMYSVTAHAFNLQVARFIIQDQKLNESTPGLAMVNSIYIPVLLKATKNYPAPDKIVLMSF